jgi:hypothetical protein
MAKLYREIEEGRKRSEKLLQAKEEKIRNVSNVPLSVPRFLQPHNNWLYQSVLLLAGCAVCLSTETS